MSCQGFGQWQQFKTIENNSQTIEMFHFGTEFWAPRWKAYQWLLNHTDIVYVSYNCLSVGSICRVGGRRWKGEWAVQGEGEGGREGHRGAHLMGSWDNSPLVWCWKLSTPNNSNTNSKTKIKQQVSGNLASDPGTAPIGFVSIFQVLLWYLCVRNSDMGRIGQKSIWGHPFQK